MLQHHEHGNIFWLCLQRISPPWDTGPSLIITASDAIFAEKAAKAVAAECGLAVRSFDLQQVLSRSVVDRITDPVTGARAAGDDECFAG